MIASSEYFIDFPRTKLRNMLELRLYLVIGSEAELPILSISTGVEVSRLSEHQRVIPTSCDHNDWLREQILD